MRFVYILSCVDATLYTGMTRDIAHRLHAHNTLSTWAKYTRSRRPVTLVWSQSVATQKEALLLEYRIKSFSRAKKLKIIESDSSVWN